MSFFKLVAATEMEFESIETEYDGNVLHKLHVWQTSRLHQRKNIKT